ncbi:Hypothetical predicted protein [Podarcis lilfordi]|uniref:Uncharacterized protein n=1 Tax=Podarcis lilfordi TaxID=74358 RepID=A0AA35P6S7_9SAUR|nr:Hypothetical predicted protein [Podarcis lilfordi]
MPRGALSSAGSPRRRREASAAPGRRRGRGWQVGAETAAGGGPPRGRGLAGRRRRRKEDGGSAAAAEAATLSCCVDGTRTLGAYTARPGLRPKQHGAPPGHKDLPPPLLARPMPSSCPRRSQSSARPPVTPDCPPQPRPL